MFHAQPKPDRFARGFFPAENSSSRSPRYAPHAFCSDFERACELFVCSSRKDDSISFLANQKIVELFSNIIIFAELIGNDQIATRKICENPKVDFLERLIVETSSPSINSIAG